MTGLVGWWPLHENSGSTARDLSGEGNHGTLNGGVTQGVAGKGGLTAYSFDGDSSYVLVGDGKQLDTYLSELTLSVWMYPRDESGSNVIAKEGDQAGVYAINHAFNGGGAELFWQDSDGTQYSQVIQSESKLNQWSHITLTWDGSTLRSYEDGKKKTSLSVSSLADNSNTLAFGANDEKGINYFDGLACEVRLYNRALSPQEIQTLYEWGSGDYTDRRYHEGSDSGAVSRLRFDGDATDSWASNDGTNDGASFVNDAIRGQGASFDSGDDSIDISKTLLDYTTDFTVSLWLSPDNVTPSEEAQVLMENGREVTMSIKNGEMRHMIYDGSSRLSESHYDIPASAWTFWTLTWDSSTNTGKFYKNGVHNPAGNNDANGNKDHTGFKLGDHPSSGYSYEGLMDDVRIYNRVLAPQEVFQLYQWGTRGRDMRKLTVNKR